MTEIMELGKFGVVGIIIALIVVIYLLVKEFIKVITNHLSHSSDIQESLIKAITELTTYLRTVNNKK